jgi:hypothetical protein
MLKPQSSAVMHLSLLQKLDRHERTSDGVAAWSPARDPEPLKRGRYDLADVIPKEGAPGLRRRLAPANQVFRNTGLTDVDSEFQQFAMNPRRAPARICVRHFAN